MGEEENATKNPTTRNHDPFGNSGLQLVSFVFSVNDDYADDSSVVSLG